jgi:hypothetical protein
MRDPRRRNRNIGTAKSGRGANNRMTIPQRWSDLSPYWQQLSSFVPVERSIGSHRLVFLVEPTRPGYAHHCTIEDILRVLKLLPAEHVFQIELVVLRQPTEKQALLRPVWGRLGYWSEIGQYSGPGVYLEAQPTELRMRWGKSLRPEDELELERLRASGFEIRPHRRGFDIHSTPAATRGSQLYRTLPHELGHYADYLACRATYEWGGDEDRFWDLYRAKPSQDREAYAHRYADEFRRQMQQRCLIPFDPLYDATAMRADRLEPAWFVRVGKRA